MIPIRDETPNRRPALATMAIIAVNVGVWLYCLTLTRQAEMAFNYIFGATPAFILGPAPAELPLPPLATLLSYQFVHGGFWHLAGNMLYLWIFGASLEDALGRGRFVVFYLLGGVLSGLAQVLSGPGEIVPIIGASGAVAMVLGGYLALFPRRNVLILLWLIFFVRVIRVPAVIFLGLWFFFQVLGSAEGVAWMAHIGGFVAGLVLARPFLPSGRPRWPGARPGGGGPTYH